MAWSSDPFWCHEISILWSIRRSNPSIKGIVDNLACNAEDLLFCYDEPFHSGFDYIMMEEDPPPLMAGEVDFSI